MKKSIQLSGLILKTVKANLVKGLMQIAFEGPLTQETLATRALLITLAINNYFVDIDIKPVLTMLPNIDNDQEAPT